MSRKFLAVLLVLGAAVTALYWWSFYFGGEVRVSNERWYTAFESSFPVADGWMALCMFAAGIGLWLGRGWGPRVGLMAGATLLYLAAMDITFDVETGLYALAPQSSAMVAEVAINVATVLLGVATLAICWRKLSRA
ncbi:MAG TPA: hypothetical protein VIM02_16305 [Rhizomicrobium sp.]|jgi:hypothetical protein